MENNDLVTDPTDVSNSFNKYYSSIAESILNKRNFVGDGNFMKYMPDPLPNSIFLEKVDADEVEKLIKVLTQTRELHLSVFHRKS